ncbi:MAG: adenylate/guanylate cyclase domain-containing protein [Candidatus Dojkabacteria bacterium]|nr:MAG: adenylate/guanylate cyclase domain-containing protein [Candidatus Dojkabacteria bacterium]
MIYLNLNTAYPTASSFAGVGKMFNKKLLNFYQRGFFEEKYKHPVRENLMILFSDIKGFTQMSEKFSSHDLFIMLDNFLTKASLIIKQNDGKIDKYLGDGILAYWNIQDKDVTYKLVLNTQEKLRELSNEYSTATNVDFTIGVGVHEGPATIGYLGSSSQSNSKTKTLIGKNVNIASRLEGLTRKYGVEALLSFPSQYARDTHDFIFRKVDIVQVKGSSTVLHIYEPMRRSNENLAKREVYEQALKLYLSGKFYHAMHKFQILYDDNPSKLMSQRIKKLSLAPKDDWDGVWNWTSK